MKSEGYTIVAVNANNITQVELLAHTIKKFDNTRPIAAIVNSQVIESIKFVDEIIVSGPEHNDSLQYFHNVVASPYDRTICLMPNQLLTCFDISVWEHLRSFGPVVLLKDKISFAYEKLNTDLYWNSYIEQATFSISSNLNIAYYDKHKGSNDICDLAIKLFDNYNHGSYLSWHTKHKEKTEVELPVFPENIRAEYIMSLLCTILGDTISRINFVDNIDLSIQDRNSANSKWSNDDWNNFLRHWVTDQSELKIENYIQHGLISYGSSDWLTPEIIRNMYAA